MTDSTLPWSRAEDIAIVDMRALGMSWERIGKELDRSKDGVRSRHKRVKSDEYAPPKPFTENDDLVIKQLTDEGYSTVDIASLMAGRTASDICERQAELFDFTGVSITKFMADRGMTRNKAHDWLFRRGYDFADGVIVKRTTYIEIEQSIWKRAASAPPAAGCWRCGARFCNDPHVARAA